jgi:hypothetical protein
MFKKVLLALNLLVLCSPVLAADKSVNSDDQEIVTIYVAMRGDQRFIVLPPQLEFEITGRHLHYVEMREKCTIISLQSKTVEVYTAAEGSNTNKIEIEQFQHGPGFYMNPRWKLVTGWPPEKDMR